MRIVEVVPHNSGWRTAFEEEAAQIRQAMGETVAAIHHIGSTAIAQIHAKPIIDILVEVHNLDQVDTRNSAMEALGYTAMGEFGMPGRRYFRKETTAGVRTHHVHTFAVGTAEAERHLAFRDYLNAHPAIAQHYSELKQKLAQAHSSDIEAYMDGKDPFIRETEQAALDWYRDRL